MISLWFVLTNTTDGSKDKPSQDNRWNRQGGHSELLTNFLSILWTYLGRNLQIELVSPARINPDWTFPNSYSTKWL